MLTLLLFSIMCPIVATELITSLKGKYLEITVNTYVLPIPKTPENVADFEEIIKHYEDSLEILGIIKFKNPHTLDLLREILENDLIDLLRKDPRMKFVVDSESKSFAGMDLVPLRVSFYAKN